MGLLIVALAVIVIAAAVTYRAYLSKTRLSEQLAHSNGELQRLNAEVRDMTQAQLTFFTNVSHELRTPLTLIADPVDHLLDTQEVRGEARKVLEMVRRNVQLLSQLVNEILDFRKIQNGKMQLRLTRFSLASALSQWASAFDAAAQGKQVTLGTVSRVEGDDDIVADHEKLSHLYRNLLSNALKYTPAGGAVTTTLTAEGDCYVISVRDNRQGQQRPRPAQCLRAFSTRPAGRRVARASDWPSSRPSPSCTTARCRWRARKGAAPASP